MDVNRRVSNNNKNKKEFNFRRGLGGYKLKNSELLKRSANIKISVTFLHMDQFI